jgi:hypothetical protein
LRYQRTNLVLEQKEIVKMVEKNVFFRLNGGMGNQLSQYAAAINYKKKYKKNIKFDDFYIKKSKKSTK